MKSNLYMTMITYAIKHTHTYIIIQYILAYMEALKNITQYCLIIRSTSDFAKLFF